MSANPLWTEDQEAIERLALRLIERPDVRAAREGARIELLNDHIAATLDERALLDRALDQWVLALAMREAKGDVVALKVVCNVCNAPRDWLDPIYLCAVVVIHTPVMFTSGIPI